MANKRKHNSEKSRKKYQIQFERTMKRIGKWRGKKDYSKYKSKNTKPENFKMSFKIEMLEKPA